MRECVEAPDKNDNVQQSVRVENLWTAASQPGTLYHHDQRSLIAGSTESRGILVAQGASSLKIVVASCRKEGAK